MIKKFVLSTSKLCFSTINKKQMEQFDKIKSWWHPASQMNVLFQYNYHRIQFLKDILNKSQHKNGDLLKPIKDFKVIDVGCGAGFLSQSLTRLGGKVVGLDPNQTSYVEATSHKIQKKSLQNLNYFNCSIQQYLQRNPEQRNSQDLVASMDVIEHVDNPSQFLDALVQSLKPGGLLMLSTISKTLYSFITHIVVAEYITGLVPKGTHNFQKFLTPQTLCLILKKSGIQVLGIRLLEYNWRGQFQQTRGGANYMIIGKKQANTVQQSDMRNQISQKQN